MDGEAYARLADLARERANRRARRPQISALAGGVIAVVIVAVVVLVFSSVAGIPEEAHETAIGVTIVLGFGAAYGWLWVEHREHDREWFREFDHLRRDYEAASPEIQAFYFEKR